ncbi:hypothetical protein AMECASPLE_035762 [Ameca splendens]|uniref:Uncharacterized protein n=1 Tax=Ameca splendens TaxID=208324 RepID=A0ABV0ZHC5_9TELE
MKRCLDKSSRFFTSTQLYSRTKNIVKVHLCHRKCHFSQFTHSSCHCGPPWLPLLDQSASTRNESWEMMDCEGYSQPILQIRQKKDTFVGRIWQTFHAGL